MPRFSSWPIVFIGMFIMGSAIGTPLIVESAPKSNPANAKVLTSLLTAPATKSLSVVLIDSEAIDALSQNLELSIDGKRIPLIQAHSERLASGHLAWYGNIAGEAVPTASGIDPLNSAILIRSGTTVTGTLRHKNRLYRLQPLPGGEHALVEIDESRLPAEHPANYAQLPEIAMRDSRLGDPTSGVDTIRVMAVATDKAVNRYGGDMLALIELAIAESNQGYLNSQVGMQLELASYTTTSYRESGRFDRDLTRFRRPHDGFMDEIHVVRDDSAADVGMLILDNPTACGLASGIGSTVKTAFASVYWSCATGYYSFAHEIGHLLSARHNPEEDPNDQPYRYGHGFVYKQLWRTIMAYDCSQGCPRLNYWSNPNVQYGGVAMGTAHLHNNAKVLGKTKATVAGFK